MSHMYYTEQVAVIEHVRELLQSFGRIEIDTERNHPEAFPDSAYSALENVLIQMELLTYTRPRAADRYPDMYPLIANMQIYVIYATTCTHV